MIAQAPLKTEAHYTLALILQELGDLEAALQRLKQVLYLDPGFVLGHFSLAVVCRQLGRLDQSQRHRQQAVKLAARLAPDFLLPGSDDLTAGRMLVMAKALN